MKECVELGIVRRMDGDHDLLAAMAVIAAVILATAMAMERISLTTMATALGLAARTGSIHATMAVISKIDGGRTVDSRQGRLNLPLTSPTFTSSISSNSRTQVRMVMATSAIIITTSARTLRQEFEPITMLLRPPSKDSTTQFIRLIKATDMGMDLVKLLVKV
jgi:hypothetical protein